MGAVPVQTWNYCPHAWVLSGQIGFLVEPKDIEPKKAPVIYVVNSRVDSGHLIPRNRQVIESGYDLRNLSFNNFTAAKTLEDKLNQ